MEKWSFSSRNWPALSIIIVRTKKKAVHEVTNRVESTEGTDVRKDIGHSESEESDL